MKKYMAFVALIHSICFGQGLENFTSLKSGGPIPSDFTTLSTEKYKTDYARNLDEELGKDFFLSSRFLIDELLLTGQILFNEPVSDFVNKVADHLLESNHELRKELRFYVLKSNVVNAFSSDQGIILVTTGLISHLENEAQLAFVLAHEISHYTHKHVRESYKEYNQIVSENGTYNVQSNEQIIARLNVYSRQHELEADSLGLQIFLNSDYAEDAAVTALTMLQYCDHPPELSEPDTTVLNLGALIIPGYYFTEARAHSISSGEIGSVDEIESGTHPDITTRINRMEMCMEQNSESKNKNVFLVSESEFQEVRNLCLFESINIHLYERQYNDALYNTIVLKKRYPDNRFLDLSLVKTLYGIAKHKNDHLYYPKRLFSETTPDLEFYRILAGIMENFDKTQSSVIAYKFCLEMKNKYPNDVIFSLYENDMKKELAIKSGLNPSVLEQTYFKYIPDTTITIIEYKKTEKSNSTGHTELSNPIKLGSKYEFKKTTQPQFDFKTEKQDSASIDQTPVIGFEKIHRSNEFYLHAFADISVNQLITELQQIKEKHDSLLAVPAVYPTKKELRKLERFGAHQGLENLVIVDPEVVVMQLDEEMNYVKSEKQKVSIQNVYEQENKQLQIDVSFVDSKNLTSGDCQEYLNLGSLNQWAYEMASYQQLEMIPSTHDQVMAISQDYQAGHFMFSYIEIRKDRPELDALHALGLVFFPTTLIAAFDLLTMQNYLYLVTIVVNAKTSEIEFATYMDIEVLGKEYMINNYMYDILFQLGPDPKLKKQ